jgi:sec-independent protein translocase protein TatB
MFEIGFQEIVLIALLALVVLGPEKLPKLAAQLGRWTGRARSMARNLRQQLEQEVSYEDLLKQKQAAEEALRTATEAPMAFHHDVTTAVETTLASANTEVEAVAQSVAETVNDPVQLAADSPDLDTPQATSKKEAVGSSS